MHLGQEPVRHAEQTSHQSHNPTVWAWTQVCNWGAHVWLDLARGQVSAKALLGEPPPGVLVSDRYAGYNFVDLQQRKARVRARPTPVPTCSGSSRRCGTSGAKERPFTGVRPRPGAPAPAHNSCWLWALRGLNSYGLAGLRPPLVSRTRGPCAGSPAACRPPEHRDRGTAAPQSAPRSAGRGHCAALRPRASAPGAQSAR